jgi:hypothetical protein
MKMDTVTSHRPSGLFMEAENQRYVIVCVCVWVGWSATLFPLNSACLDRLPFDQRSVACFTPAVCSLSRHYVTEMLTCGRVHDSICCDVWVRAQQPCMYNQSAFQFNNVLRHHMHVRGTSL